MSLISCYVELKLKPSKYCVFSEVDADNVNAHSNNIIFTIKDTKLYFHVVTLSTESKTITIC